MRQVSRSAGQYVLCHRSPGPYVTHTLARTYRVGSTCAGKSDPRHARELLEEAAEAFGIATLLRTGAEADHEAKWSLDGRLSNRTSNQHYLYFRLLANLSAVRSGLLQTGGRGFDPASYRAALPTAGTWIAEEGRAPDP